MDTQTANFMRRLLALEGQVHRCAVSVIVIAAIQVLVAFVLFWIVIRG